MKVNIDWVREGPHDVFAVTQHCPREQLLRFVAAHGVDVNDVPLPSAVTIEDGQVTFEVVVRGEDGHPVFDEKTLAVEHTTVTVPQCVPWPLAPLDPPVQPHLPGCAYPHGGVECSCLPSEAG